MSTAFSRTFWEEFCAEEERVNELADIKERKVRYTLLYAIKEKIGDYMIHIKEYEYGQKRREITDRGVSFLPVENGGTLKSQWDKLFARLVDAETKKKIHFGQFLWHIFSFEIIPSLVGTEARKAFDQCPKNEVYAFFQHKDEAFLIKNPSLLKSQDFDMDDDIYIFDAIEKWTYIHTHEEQCGPYFYSDKL